MPFLGADSYVCVEPNWWLTYNSMLINDGDLAIVFWQKRAMVLHNVEFDATELLDRYPSLSFDIVFSHSILSHAADYQLLQYFTNTRKMVSLGGKSLMSIR